jgi:hypothetical protein
MTLTDAKQKFNMNDFGMRLLINTSLVKGEDYFIDVVKQKRILNFTIKGESKLPKLVREIRKEDPVC